MKIGDFVTHPAADELPLMSEEEFDELLESIQEHGQLEPVLIFRRKNNPKKKTKGHHLLFLLL